MWHSIEIENSSGMDDDACAKAIDNIIITIILVLHELWWTQFIYTHQSFENVYAFYMYELGLTIFHFDYSQRRQKVSIPQHDW